MPQRQGKSKVHLCSDRMTSSQSACLGAPNSFDRYNRNSIINTAGILGVIINAALLKQCTLQGQH